MGTDNTEFIHREEGLQGGLLSSEKRRGSMKIGPTHLSNVFTKGFLCGARVEVSGGEDSSGESPALEALSGGVDS